MTARLTVSLKMGELCTRPALAFCRGTLKLIFQRTSRFFEKGTNQTPFTYRFSRWSRRFTLSIAFLLMASLWGSTLDSKGHSFAHINVSQAEKAKIQNGDIIFRKATGIGSQYILSIDKSSSYSHAGIIRKVGDRITVIQSAPETTLLDAGVHEEPLESFLENTPLVAVYRLQREPVESADKAVQIAQTFIGIPFDADLDMTDSHALYCTELVWLSYKLSGIDLLDGQYDYLDIPIVGRGYYILPSSLVDSYWLDQVMILRAENLSGG